MKQKMRFLSWILIAVMTVCQLPGLSMPVFASQTQEIANEGNEEDPSLDESEEDITESSISDNETVTVSENESEDISTENEETLNEDSSESYDLYVGGVQVTSANKDDITAAIVDSGQTATGQAKYDPDAKTLTIKNFEFIGIGYQDSSAYPMCGGIWSGINDLTLVIDGDNNITEVGGSRPTSIGIWAENGLIIKGIGTLTAKGSTPTPYSNGHGYSYGIGGRSCLIDDDFTGTLNAISSNITNNLNSYASVGLSVSHTLTINNGTVNAYSGDSLGNMGISAGIIASDVIINGGNLTAVGGASIKDESYGIYVPSRTIYINGGTVKASGKYGAMTHTEFGEDTVIKASFNADGSELEDYSASNASGYKYIYATFTERFYDLYVGGVHVTNLNRNKLVSEINASGGAASGIITFDSKTNTLYMKDATVTARGTADYRGDSCTITTTLDKLTIAFSGTNNIGCEYPYVGSYAYYNGIGCVSTDLVFEGEDGATLTVSANSGTAPENGAICPATITVNGGTVIAQSPYEKRLAHVPYGLSLNKSGGVLLTVNKGKLISTGWAPICASNFTADRVSPNTMLRGSKNADGSESESYDYANNGGFGDYGYQNTYRYVEAVPITDTPYDLYINGTRVTGLNAYDLSLIEGVEGNASYDAETNTLNLNGVDITGTDTSDVWAGIKYLGYKQLNINVNGQNHIVDNGVRNTASAGILTGEYNDYNYWDNAANVNISISEGGLLELHGGYVSGGYYPSTLGCYVQGMGKLTISGKGTLSTCGGKSKGGVNEGYSYGICANSISVDMEEGNVFALGQQAYFSTGIATTSGFHIYNGKVLATADDACESYGVYASNWMDPNGINLEGGELIAAGGNATKDGFGIYCENGNFIINGGKLTASTESDTASSRAISKAPTLAAGLIAGASKNSNGSRAEKYIEEKNSEYKWFSVPYEDWGEIPASFKAIFNNDYTQVPEGIWYVFGNNTMGYTPVYTSADEIIDYSEVYTGSAITFNENVYVFHGSRKLWENRDYTLSYKNNVNAADAHSGAKAPVINVKGKGTYSSTADFKFSIRKTDLSKATLVSERIVTAAAGSKIGTIKPSLTFAGKKLTAGKDYDLSYYYDSVADSHKIADPAKTNVAAGGYYQIWITAHAGSNFEGAFAQTVTVRGVDAKAKNIVAMNKVKVNAPKAKDLPYTESGYKLSELFDNSNGKAAKATVVNRKEVLEYGKHYTVYSPDEDENGVIKDSGKHTVVIHGCDNEHVGDKLATIEIGGTPAGKVKIAGLASNVEYSGKSYTYADLFTPDKTTKANKWNRITLYVVNNKKIETLEEDKDYKVEVSHNGATGKVDVIYTFMGKYNGVTKKAVNVKVRNITAATVEVSDAEFSKAGAVPDDIVVKLGDEILREGIDYTLSYSNNAKPGKKTDKSAPTVTATGIGNYAGKAIGKYNVNKSDIRKHVTLAATDKTYDEKAKPGYFKSVPKLMDGGKAISVGKDVSKINKTDYKYYYAGTDTEIPDDTIVPAGTWIEVRVTVKCLDNSPYEAGENLVLTGRYRMIQKGYDLKSAKVTVKNKNIQFNNGKPILLENNLSVVLNKKELTTDDYEIVSIRNNRFLGTATVEIRGKGQYGGSKTFTFKISAKALK